MENTTSLPSFINDLADRILSQCRSSEQLLTNDSVVLRKRFRDLNDSDRTGFFSGVTGSWSDIDTQQLYTLNIVKPMLRTNASAMQTAKVKIDIAPRFTKDTKSQMATQVSLAIIEQKERLQWTSQLEEYVAMEQQMAPGVFLRTFHDKTKKKTHKLPKWEMSEVEMPGVAVCGECGSETPVEGEVEEIVPCGACGGVAVVESMPTTEEIDVPTGYEEFTVGDTETQVHPFFEFRVDDLNTQGGRLDNAKWFEHHYPQSTDELEMAYPESKKEIQGSSLEFSYSLKWQRALKQNRMTPSDTLGQSVVEEREVRDIYLTPSMYLNHPVSEDFALTDKDGNVRFAIKKGQTCAEAEYEGKVPEEPPTVKFKLVGMALLDVCICDFKKEWSYMTFLANPSAFWGSFIYEIVALQDIVTYLISLQFYHVKRNAITSIVYNKSSFDPESFGKDLIPTKQNLPYDIPIGSQFGIVPALALSGEPMQLFGAIMETKGDVTLTTPAMMGQAQPNEPYAAQALQKQSSMGLLAPAEISKATAKVHWAKQQLRCAKQYLTDEDAEELLKLNPEWNEDTIMAFKECDFDKDLIITYKQGTEIPQSLIEREIKLQNLLQQFVMLGGVGDGQLIPPDAIKEVINEMIQSSGLDIDVGNNESNLRLAESRYDHLTMMLKGVPPTEDMMMMQQIAMQIAQLPLFQPLPYEDYGLIIEFFSDKARNEASREMPNYLLLTCLNALIQVERQGQVQHAQEEGQMQMEASAPMIQAQQQMEQASEEAKIQGQLQLQEAQANDPSMQINAQNDERQREVDMQMQERELADNAEERKATLEQARLQNQAKAKEAKSGK